MHVYSQNVKLVYCLFQVAVLAVQAAAAIVPLDASARAKPATRAVASEDRREGQKRRDAHRLKSIPVLTWRQLIFAFDITCVH